MRPATRYPWSMSTIKFEPAGLREAVLRAIYSAKQATDRPRASRPGMFATVRAWQRGEGATPEQWAELQTLVLQSVAPRRTVDR